MDPLLLKYYERELHFIREMGEEFSQEYPKVAGQLGIDGASTSDPYVERLYEGFAFLAARIQLRIDAEYPKFTENMLNVVYPQYLTPTPSMAMVQFRPAADAGYETGAVIPRETLLRANRRPGDQTACQFRTAHEVTLWPVKVDFAEYMVNVAHFGKLLNPVVGERFSARPKAGLRLRLKTLSGQPFSSLSLDSLSFHLAGHDGQAARLYEQILGNRVAVLYKTANSQEPWKQLSQPAAVTSVGFSNEQALFPNDHRTFSGYRLLREYFSFPERFLFVQLNHLQTMVSGDEEANIEVVLLFDRCDSELENRVDANNFQLFCTPSINLFPKRVDRIHLNEQVEEYHVVPDRTRPMDFEVFQIEDMVGYGINAEQKQPFKPLYQTNGRQQAADNNFYTLRRQRRQLSEAQRKKGTRTSYLGSESFVTLVDRSDTPADNEVKQLGIQALCTNRDLPLRFPTGRNGTDFALDVSAPVASIHCVKGPTRPRPSMAHENGQLAWRLINQLSLNYLTLVDQPAESGAEALRELMSLYGDLSDAAIRKQIDGVISVSSQQVTRRLPLAGPIAFGRGLEITVTVEENAFVGTGVFLLGAVLEQFFARYVSINSFTETVICSEERGEVHRWSARVGQRQIV